MHSHVWLSCSSIKAAGGGLTALAAALVGLAALAGRARQGAGGQPLRVGAPGLQRDGLPAVKASRGLLLRRLHCLEDGRAGTPLLRLRRTAAMSDISSRQTSTRLQPTQSGLNNKITFLLSLVCMAAGS